MKPVADTELMLFQTANRFRICLFGCFSGFAPPGRLVLLVAVLSCCSDGVKGEASDDRPVKIRTYAGETVILPCHISVRDDHDVPSSVEWSKEGLNPNIAFLYRDGCETFHEKNPVFRYRTNLIMNKLKNGNISLRLSNVSLSDAGKYVCKMIQKPPRVVATVELFVGAVSEPKLSVVPAVDGGVTLQCEADCWFPQPEITFLDAQRNNISAGDTKTDEDSSRGCFTATKRLTVQTANRVTCIVHQPKINQTRVTGIHIPDDCMRSCTLSISIAVIVSIACICAGLCLCKKYGTSVGRHKFLLPQSSLQSSTRSNAEGHNLRNQTEEATAELRGEIAELKSNLLHKEEIIHRLTEEVNDLRSKQSPVVCQHDQHGQQPTIDNNASKSSPDVSKSINLPPEDFPHDNNPKPAASTNSNRPKSVKFSQNKDSRPGVSIQNPALGPQIQRSRAKSTPALLTNSSADLSSASSAFPSDATPVGRSRSMSDSLSRPKGTKPERRYTFSAASSNRFAVLENVPEDDVEPLL
ncbi:uncharacterized protein LOC119482063 [Sebastes umbrosus]|uniref:uncharacterized protein LOC119482063 n=1 Tax=Sebastes umbrosus TaxID=72105 RepID=UPI0018A0812E|nr:uncharacterized protein LOC119482063 [Sebastes umbrosus]